MNIFKTFWAFKIFKYFQYFLFKVLSMYEYTFGAKSITVLTPKIIKVNKYSIAVNLNVFYMDFVKT